jgi:hypothetical protein
MLVSGNSGLATCSGVSGGAVIIVDASGQPWLLNESMPLFLGIKHAYMIFGYRLLIPSAAFLTASCSV